MEVVKWLHLEWSKRSPRTTALNRTGRTRLGVGSRPRSHVIEQAAQRPGSDSWLACLVRRGPAPAAGGRARPGRVRVGQVVGAGLATDGRSPGPRPPVRVKVADLGAADPRAALLVPESVARKHRVLPLSADDRNIRVATADPRDFNAEQAIGFMTGREVEFQVSLPDLLHERMDATYRPERSIERLLDRLEPAQVETLLVERRWRNSGTRCSTPRSPSWWTR